MTMAKSPPAPVDMFGNDHGEPVTVVRTGNGTASVTMGHPPPCSCPSAPAPGMRGR